MQTRSVPLSIRWLASKLTSKESSSSKAGMLSLHVEQCGSTHDTRVVLCKISDKNCTLNCLVYTIKVL